MTHANQPHILLTGGTGVTGRRIAERLRSRHIPIRCASRVGSPPFEWNQPDTWNANLHGATAVYLAYAPDLAMPGAVETIERFCAAGVLAGVQQFVLLAGRGEPEAEAAEAVVRRTGARWTVVRASWFDQNFTEGMLRQSVLSGTIALPGGTVAEPFVDADDIADVAVAALTQVGHDGRTYDVTGPRLMTFSEAAAELSTAVGHPVQYLDVSPSEFVDGAISDGVPADIAASLAAMFDRVLDGRNSYLGDGVFDALGRAPRDFRDFLADATAAHAWADDAQSPSAR